MRELSDLRKLGLDIAFAGQITNFDAKQFVTPRKSLKVMSHETQWAHAAAKMACHDAGLEAGSVDPDRFGVVFGADMIYSEPEDLIDIYRNCIVDGRFDFSRWGDAMASSMTPLWMLKYLPNMAACHIGIALDAHGPNNSILVGEASSLVAMDEALRLIERGVVDVVITGGSSNPVNFVSWAFRHQRHSRRQDNPAGACRPFDADRDGMVCGQGAAALVFESRRHAESRRARVLARVESAAHAFDPAGRAAASTVGQGAGVARVARQSLARAGRAAEDLGFIVAHGYGTPGGDLNEARGILAVAPRTPVTALKGYWGCLGAASGAVETAAAIMALGEGRIPRALNSLRPDPQCPLEIVRDDHAPVERSRALVLTQSTLGQSAAVLIAGPEAD